MNWLKKAQQELKKYEVNVPSELVDKFTSIIDQMFGFMPVSITPSLDVSKDYSKWTHTITYNFPDTWSENQIEIARVELIRVNNILSTQQSEKTTKELGPLEEDLGGGEFIESNEY